MLRTKSIILKRRLSVNNLNNHNEPINVTESVESTNERPVFYDEPILYESALDENCLVESPTNRSQTTFDEDLLNESEDDENSFGQEYNSFIWKPIQNNWLAYGSIDTAIPNGHGTANGS